MKALDRIPTVRPNCAGDKEIGIQINIPYKRPWHSYCVRCGQYGYTSERALTVRGAIKKWNRAWRRRFLSEIT